MWDLSRDILFPGCPCGIVPWLLCPKSFDLNSIFFFFKFLK